MFAPQLGQILDYVAQLERYAGAAAAPEETPRSRPTTCPPRR